MRRIRWILMLFVILLAGIFVGSACSAHKNENDTNTGRKQSRALAYPYHRKGVLDVLPLDAHHILSVGRDSVLILWNADSGWALASKKLPRLPRKIGLAGQRDVCWVACRGGVFFRISTKNLGIENSVSTLLHDVEQFKYSIPLKLFLGRGTNELFRFEPHKAQFRVLSLFSGNAVALNVNAQKPLVALFKKGRVRILDARTMKMIAAVALPAYKERRDGERQVAFVGEQGLVASYGENVWMGHWRSGQMRLLPKNHHAPITALAVSENGRFVATGSMDKSIKLWSWPQGDLQGSFFGHFLTVNALSFADSGRKLISGSEDGTLVIWNLKNKLPEKRLGSLKIAMKNPWRLKVKSVHYARSFKAGGEEYNVSDTKTRLIKVNAEIKNTGLADNIFFSSNLFLIAPDQTRFHCVGLEHYVALSPKAYFKRRIAPGKSLKGNFIFIIKPPYKQYAITYETLQPIALKNF